jgi:S1-C subfamily serine protease
VLLAGLAVALAFGPEQPPEAVPAVQTAERPAPRPREKPRKKAPPPPASKKKPLRVQVVREVPEPDKVPLRPKPGMPAGFEGWLQDPESARRVAAQENKDVLILFGGSDWCRWTKRLAQEVLFTPAFRDWAGRQFVLVLVDFPQHRDARAKVEDPGRNQRLFRVYEVEGFPTVVLTDAQGRSYGVEHYRKGGPEAYLAHLAQQLRDRARRDELFGAVAREQGAGQLEAARKALAFVEEKNLEGFYRPELRQWLRLAERHDPDNAAGTVETFFAADWMSRVKRVNPEEPAQVAAVVGLLDAWKKNYRFKDKDVGAFLHLAAARLLALAGRHERAEEYLQAGQRCGPTNPWLVRLLADPLAALGFSTGTGFVVGEGLLLTNWHVVKGPGQALVRVPGREKPLLAAVVAADKRRDIALLRVALPQGLDLRPLGLPLGLEVRRGQEVMNLGFPLGDRFGKQVKMHRGTVSAPPDPDSGNPLLLDVKVNPGDSGAPLFDACSNVVGMVSAKTAGGGRVDSDGLAIPAADLVAFLQNHVMGYRPAAPARAK